MSKADELAGLRAMRKRLRQLEKKQATQRKATARQVERAKRAGATGDEIAKALGVSRQAVHKAYSSSGQGSKRT